MKDLVTYIAKSLVDNPDEVAVEEEIVGERLIIHLSVSDEDKGKVIGRNGMIANSIRTMLDIVAKKSGIRVSLSIE
ncbi:MAG: KH domain-containing protein [Dehalococcoidia bacterium]